MQPQTVGPCAVQNPTECRTFWGKSGSTHRDSDFGHNSVFVIGPSAPIPPTTNILGLDSVFELRKYAVSPMATIEMPITIPMIAIVNFFFTDPSRLISVFSEVLSTPPGAVLA